ncbi:MAG: hypothetical protein KDC46_12350 [Thermoleophilia bacterium]|nr:hypothetical protein [Thermoleophilia bacterium]
MPSRRKRPEISPYIDRFGVLLLITIVALVLLSLIDMRSSYLGAAIVQSSVVVVLLLALRASGVPRRRRRLFDWLLLVGLFATIAIAVFDHFDPGALSSDAPRSFSPLALVAGILAPILITRRVLHHERVTRATVLGAIASYLLIALAFGMVFLAVDEYQATPFFGHEQPTTVFFYFSLVSVATLGYGDFTPVTPLGQLLGAMDAVVGQVFLVTFVAMIVGRLVGEGSAGLTGSAAPARDASED